MHNLWRCSFFLLLLIVLAYCKTVAQTYDTLPQVAHGADTIPRELNRYTDSLYQVYNTPALRQGRILMTRKGFDMFFSKYFSYLVSSKEGLPDGNSVSITPTSNATRVQANLAVKNLRTIYNFGIQADYTDNVANLFSAKDITSNTTFYVNTSFLHNGTRNIEYNVQVGENYNLKERLKLQEFASGINAKYLVMYRVDSLAYQTAKHLYDSLLAIAVNIPVDSNIVKSVKAKNDMVTALNKVGAYGLNEKPDMYNIYGLLDDEVVQLKDSIKALIDTMDAHNPAWTRFKFGWVSVGVTYTRQQYKTYDSNLVFTDRVKDIPFNNAGLTIGYNFISQKNEQLRKVLPKYAFQAIYINAAYSVVNDLNYSHLTVSDLLTIHPVTGADTVYQFQTSSKVRDISGAIKKTSWLHTFGIQSSFILPKTNFMGFTLGINSTFSRFASPLYNGRFGLLFRFLNSDDGKSKVNFEVFFQLPDWNDSKGSGKSTWQRKAIGFNATIPFNKLFF